MFLAKQSAYNSFRASTASHKKRSSLDFDDRSSLMSLSGIENILPKKPAVKLNKTAQQRIESSNYYAAPDRAVRYLSSERTDVRISKTKKQLKSMRNSYDKKI